MEDKDLRKDILRSHNLRITDCRLDVVDFFLKEKKALSRSDLEHQLKQYDPVTLYRTLNTFSDSGIIHKIPNDSGAATYGLSNPAYPTGKHGYNHIHFKCHTCGRIECIKDEAVPHISVPVGYQIEVVNLIVDGTCAKCV